MKMEPLHYPWPIYTLLTEIFTAIAYIAGILVTTGTPQLVLFGTVLMACALGGQAFADYLKNVGVITLLKVSQGFSVYTLLKLVLTIIAVVAGVLVQSNYSQNVVIFGEILAAIAAGGNVLVDYLYSHGVLTLSVLTLRA
jgi:hypothetical protein